MFSLGSTNSLHHATSYPSLASAPTAAVNGSSSHHNYYPNSNETAISLQRHPPESEAGNPHWEFPAEEGNPQL